MVKLKYRICSPIRLLLPCSVAFFSLPLIFKKALFNFYIFGLFYFFGSYFIFLNFPVIPQILHSKPTYIEDLVISENKNDDSFKQIYTVVMSFILAMLFGIFAEYIFIQGVQDKSVIEVFGIIGGNLGLYIKAQSFVGKFLLSVCYNFKVNKLDKIKRKISEDIQMEEIKNIPK